jgi:hypothetical protein
MLSSRERLIAISALIAVVILVGDQWVWTPLTAWRGQLTDQKLHVLEQLQANQRLMHTRRELAPRWRQIVTAGVPTDPAASESKLLYTLRDAAKQTQVNLLTVQPERPAGKGELREVIVAVSGSGSMSAISRFLYQLDTTEVPLRIERLRLATAEGRDEMKIELRISTLWRQPPKEDS